MPNFRYQVIRSRRLTSTTSVTIHPEKGVIVRAPFWLPVFAIDNFVREKSVWIEKQLAQTTKTLLPKNYSDGELHLYLGREYPLQINRVDVRVRTQVSLLDDTIVAVVYDHHPFERFQSEIRDGIIRWYLESGITFITERVNFYSAQIGVQYSQIAIKKVSSIWGSCSPSNKLSFNRKLIMAPKEVVDYVVIHEVCHMVHRNHSSRFWGLVAKFDPQFRQHRQWLRKNHMLLSI